MLLLLACPVACYQLYLPVVTRKRDDDFATHDYGTGIFLPRDALFYLWGGWEGVMEANMASNAFSKSSGPDCGNGQSGQWGEFFQSSASG